MRTKSKSAAITLPFTALKCLYRSTQEGKLVCEIDIASLRQVNEPDTIDEMVAEARFDYFSGKTKGFTDTEKLMAYLNDGSHDDYKKWGR